MINRIAQPLFAGLVAITLMIGATMAAAADREKLEAFLHVTGFDVALESIRLSADSAPRMLGIEAEAFGSEWQRLVREVFDTQVMHEMAIDLLSQTLTDEALAHAAGFYATDLGRRLVAAENASHLTPDDAGKGESGALLVEAMRGAGSPRLEVLERLNRAANTEDVSVRSLQEVQIRFLMAAAAAGVIELQLEEPDLREAMRSGEEDLRKVLRESALEGSAYTYQAFSDEELVAYAEALENPTMREVYTLMNAVQYEIMANRFEAIADRLAAMQPSQDL